MTNLSLAMIQKWKKHLSVRCLNLNAYNLGDMIELADIKVHHEFLTEAIKRWDLKTHTFWFGTREICPTIEEFRAIMKVTHRGHIVLAPNDAPRSYLQAQVNMTKKECALITPGGRLDEEALFQHITNYRCSKEAADYATVVLLLSQYYLKEKPSTSARILSVAALLKEGSFEATNLILAETLLGLDMAIKTKTTLQQGSPTILFIWLAEKLRMLSPHPREISLTAQKQKERFWSPAKDFNKYRIRDDIELRMTQPWYKIIKMVSHVKDRDVILVLGLQGVTYYLTGRISGQFGRTTSSPAIERSEVPIYNQALCRAYVDNQAHQRTTAVIYKIEVADEGRAHKRTRHF